MDTVGAIVTEKGRTVYTIGPRATAFAAVEEMCGRRVGALLVTRDDVPLGIFSERDLMVRVILAKRDPATTPIEEVMTHDVVCVSPETEPAEAMAIMTAKRCRHLPVVEGGHVVGIVSIGDLVRFMSRSQEYEIRLLKDYVFGSYPGS
jgi:CBS domain-containing protein